MKTIPKSVSGSGWFFLVVSALALFSVVTLTQVAVVPTYFLAIALLSCVLQFITGVLLIGGKKSGQILTYIIGFITLFDLIGTISSGAFSFGIILRAGIICVVLFSSTATTYFNALKKSDI